MLLPCACRQLGIRWPHDTAKTALIPAQGQTLP